MKATTPDRSTGRSVHECTVMVPHRSGLCPYTVTDAAARIVVPVPDMMQPTGRLVIWARHAVCNELSMTNYLCQSAPYTVDCNYISPYSAQGILAKPAADISPQLLIVFPSVIGVLSDATDCAFMFHCSCSKLRRHDGLRM